MTEYSKQLTQPRLWFWGLSFFYGAICLAITCSWTNAQEMPHESYESFAIPQPTGSPDGLPRVRSLGKLVSIEGAVGDPGMVREIEGTNTESEFLTEFPLGFDPESQANQFKLPNLIYSWRRRSIWLAVARIGPLSKTRLSLWFFDCHQHSSFVRSQRRGFAAEIV